jgi:hypothetical protein
VAVSAPRVIEPRWKSWLPVLDVVVRRRWRDGESPDETVVLLVVRWSR